MASVDSAWTLDDELAVVRDLAQMVSAHGSRAAVRLLLAPSDLEIDDDEVLVQRVDATSRTIVIEPRKISELGAGDVLHDACVVDPADVAYVEHADAMKAAKCLYRYPDGKTHQAIYN